MSDHPPFDRAALRRAVELYLGLAYPDGNLPEAIRRRLDWPDGADLATVLAGPPFERANRPEPGVEPIYALRLGNARYPHMKLQIQRWPNADGYLLSVNTHDQILNLSPTAKDADAFRVLQAENQAVKEKIEQAWAEAGIPTFLQYLRDFIAENQAVGGEPVG